MLNEQLSNLTHASFRFVIDIDGDRQGAFTECTLPVVEWDAEEIKEGGLNSYTHLLPGRLKPARVTLKNGIGKNKLLDWYIDSMNQKFTRKTVTISVLDSYRKPVQTWNINEACPVKLTGPELRSDSNTIAIQSLEFICGEVTIT